MLVATVMLAAGEREAALDLMEQTVAAAQAAGLEKAIDYDRAFFEFKAGKHAEARRLLRQYMQSNPQFERFARADRRWDGFTETLTAKR